MQNHKTVSASPVCEYEVGRDQFHYNSHKYVFYDVVSYGTYVFMRIDTFWLVTPRLCVDGDDFNEKHPMGPILPLTLYPNSPMYTGWIQCTFKFLLSPLLPSHGSICTARRQNSLFLQSFKESFFFSKIPHEALVVSTLEPEVLKWVVFKDLGTMRWNFLLIVFLLISKSHFPAGR